MVQITRANFKRLVEKETTIECFNKVYKYLSGIGYIQDYYYYDTPSEQINKGDFGFLINGKMINVDFKKDNRGRKYLPIELIQVGANNSYSSWLYRDDIDYVVYTNYDNKDFLFPKETLRSVAAYYLSQKDIWDTCIIYKKNPLIYNNEKTYIEVNLSKYQKCGIRKAVVSEYDVHINGAFNYSYDGTKKHSGFCLNLPTKILGELK